MKKFILVMIFVFLTAFLIAFNYLLWDRESKIEELKNLEYANAGYNANINSQKREIDALEEEIAGLNGQIKQLEKENERLKSENEALTAGIAGKEEELRQKINFINDIKQHINIDVVSEPIIKWAEALNQGNHEEAYAIEYGSVPEKNRPLAADYVEQMKETIRRIDIIEIKIDKTRGSGNGEIFLAVKLDAKLAGEAGQPSARFAEGENEIYVKMDYSDDKKGFIISAITG